MKQSRLTAINDHVREARSFCRICNAHCGMVLTIDESDRIIDIRGDDDQTMGKGYACFKGLQAEEAHHGSARLLHPLKRKPGGGFERIELETALDEISEKVAKIISRDGPVAISLFNGNGGTPNSSGYPMTLAFMAALGSPSLYSTLSIDQSAKNVAFERQGAWAAGLQDMSQSEVLLPFGSNPLVSHATIPLMGPDPVRRLKSAKSRGLKLIVVDPRRTETAKFADLFLQPVPGQDPAILAAMLRIILEEGWEDAAFCSAHVGASRMTNLRAAVDPFTPEFAADRAGLNAAQIREAAEIFARNHRSGAAYAATGPCMAPFSNLSQHLVETINIVCGRMRRVGDALVVDLLAPEASEVRAEVIPPPRSWEALPASRIRGVGRLNGERLTGTLAEEIMKPGEGQIRALFVNGGNPAVSIPDQRRITAALKSLELLVVVDPYMTPTATMAHYILPPRMQYERADLPLQIPGFPLYPENWIQFTPALIHPPKGSQLVEDWYVYWSIAKRLGLALNYEGAPLGMLAPPTTEELLSIRLKRARISLEELRRHASGVTLENPAWRVQPGRADSNARFDVMPTDVALELREFYREGGTSRDGLNFLLSCRRSRDTFNSNGIQLGSVRARNPHNPLHVHPHDLKALGLTSGEPVEITSERGCIVALAVADESMRRGVVSISHGWGGLPDDDSRDGDNVNMLVDSTQHVEAINAMPRMSAIPVRLTRSSEASKA